jgi:hypothetical protein
LPLAPEIAEAIAKATGETIMAYGAQAARQLQLTTVLLRVLGGVKSNANYGIVVS